MDVYVTKSWLDIELLVPTVDYLSNHLPVAGMDVDILITYCQSNLLHTTTLWDIT